MSGMVTYTGTEITNNMVVAIEEDEVYHIPVAALKIIKEVLNETIDEVLLKLAFEQTKEGKRRNILKDFQKKAIESMVRESVSTAVVSLKTGGGKTCIFQTTIYLLYLIRNILKLRLLFPHF